MCPDPTPSGRGKFGWGTDSLEAMAERKMARFKDPISSLHGRRITAGTDLCARVKILNGFTGKYGSQSKRHPMATQQDHCKTQIGKI